MTALWRRVQLYLGFALVAALVLLRIRAGIETEAVDRATREIEQKDRDRADQIRRAVPRRPVAGGVQPAEPGGDRRGYRD